MALPLCPVQLILLDIRHQHLPQDIAGVDAAAGIGVDAAGRVDGTNGSGAVGDAGADAAADDNVASV
ncbi:hypothetical protein DPEC_G00367860 [Dallia pectoralis]|nr:hypothetical protein DPEC_G00367860 [Dallia pectoralis]